MKLKIKEKSNSDKKQKNITKSTRLFHWKTANKAALTQDGPIKISRAGCTESI